MKTILTLTLALALTGCANLPLLNEPDPQVVAADQSLNDDVVQRLLAYVKKNPHIIGMDTANAAKMLEGRADSNRLNLKNARTVFRRNRTGDNKDLLMRAKTLVDNDRGAAESILNSQVLPQSRGMGAPFAPPMIVSQPVAQPVIVNNSEILPELVKMNEHLSSIRNSNTRIIGLLTTNAVVRTPPPPPGTNATEIPK